MVGHACSLVYAVVTDATPGPPDGTTTVKTHWFQSPLEHWLSGILTEAFTLGGFLLVTWAAAVALMWLFAG